METAVDAETARRFILNASRESLKRIPDRSWLKELFLSLIGKGKRVKFPEIPLSINGEEVMVIPKVFWVDEPNGHTNCMFITPTSIDIVGKNLEKDVRLSLVVEVVKDNKKYQIEVFRDGRVVYSPKSIGKEAVLEIIKTVAGGRYGGN